MKEFQIEALVDYERCHSSATFGTRYDHSVDRSVDHPWTLADNIGQFGGRDIFPFPAEGVAKAIDKVEVSAFVPAHQIACAKPEVASDKDIPQKLCFRCHWVRITLELAWGTRTMLRNPANRFTDFIRGAADAESNVVALRLTLFIVEFD